MPDLPMQSGSALVSIPNRQDLAKYVVNREGWEGIRNTLYDSAVYPAAGSTQLSFFALPIGQGTSAFTGAKTYSDTNMELAGQLPANKEFLVQSVEIHFFPTLPTVAANMPSAFGAQASAAQLNDTMIFYRSGNLQFVIGSKPYLQEAPLVKFPPKAYYDLSAAASDGGANAATTQQLRMAWANAKGRPFMLAPANLLLQSNQNFSITLNWPEGLQAITNPARVTVVLDGFLYRRSQ